MVLRSGQTLWKFQECRNAGQEGLDHLSRLEVLIKDVLKSMVFGAWREYNLGKFIGISAKVIPLQLTMCFFIGNPLKMPERFRFRNYKDLPRSDGSWLVEFITKIGSVQPRL